MIHGSQSEPGRALPRSGSEKIKVAKKRLSDEGRVRPCLVLMVFVAASYVAYLHPNSAVPASDPGSPLNTFACEQNRLCALDARLPHL
jgi:hypothetical protein